MNTALADLVDVVMGQAPPGHACNKLGEGTPFVKAGEFADRRPVVREWTTKPLRMAQQGDTLVCVVGATAGKVNLGIDCAIGRSVAAVRPLADRIDSHFLYRFLSTTISRLRGDSQGAAQRVITREMIGNLQLDLPPLAEQRRIAAILDQADTLRAKRRQVLTHLDSLTQSMFHEMFGDPISNSRKAPSAAIGALAEVVTGNSPSRADSGNFGSAIEWIKSDNLGDNVASEATEWLSEHGRNKARIAPPDSVLVTCIAGSPTSIGKASLVDREVAFNQQINAILPSARVDCAFLLAQLKTAPGLVRAKSTGGMKGLVNKSAFQSIQVLTPPLDEQREFAARLERINGHRAAVKHALAADDELFASLQARAFQGTL